MLKHRVKAAATCLAVPCMLLTAGHAGAGTFTGKYFAGKGNVKYLKLLETAREVLSPNPRLQSLPMLYTPSYNGFTEGPTWWGWWIQNSYGPTYCGMPFLRQPLLTFLQNSQDLWFNLMGDGKTKRPGVGGIGPNGQLVTWRNWQIGGIAPNGCLCDDATPTSINYRQGDGRVSIHDWAMEMSAAGLSMQSELLLETRNQQAISKYLPKLERVANFVWIRHDPRNNLFLAGDAANLLGPSYAGYKEPDGNFGKAYLTGLSITYIAAINRLIQVEKLAGHPKKAALYTRRRNLARLGLPLLTTKEGYFIKSLDPDGVRHGVYGAPKYGYFCTSPNVDAICFNIVGLAQAKSIYDMIRSIPGLRPYTFIIANYPSLDDMDVPATGHSSFGKWVNGGEWATVEARAIMAYYRVGAYQAAERSMERWLDFAKRYRLDNPLCDFGDKVSQPNQPINLTYDMFGIPTAMLRGLFEYIYTAKGLTLIPQIPSGITELEQKFPVRFGHTRLYICTVGNGSVRAVRVNGRVWRSFDNRSVFLSYQKMPSAVYVQIALGNAKLPQASSWPVLPMAPAAIPAVAANAPQQIRHLAKQGRHVYKFWSALAQNGLGQTFAAHDAHLLINWIVATINRHTLESEGKIQPLKTTASQTAADKAFFQTERLLYEGLAKVIESYKRSENPRKKEITSIWQLSSVRPAR